MVFIGRSVFTFSIGGGPQLPNERTGAGGEGENKNEKQGGPKGAQPPDEARVEVRTMKSK